MPSLPTLTREEQNLRDIDSLKILSKDVTKQVNQIQEKSILIQHEYGRRIDRLTKELEETKKQLDYYSSRYFKLQDKHTHLEHMMEMIHDQSRKRSRPESEESQNEDAEAI